MKYLQDHTDKMYTGTIVNVLYSLLDIFVYTLSESVPMPARSKTWVCGH